MRARAFKTPHSPTNPQPQPHPHHPPPTTHPPPQVEATKFTEVGFHGRDVDQIVRDLVDAAVVQVGVAWGVG